MVPQVSGSVVPGAWFHRFLGKGLTSAEVLDPDELDLDLRAFFAAGMPFNTGLGLGVDMHHWRLHLSGATIIGDLLDSSVRASGEILLSFDLLNWGAEHTGFTPTRTGWGWMEGHTYSYARHNALALEAGGYAGRFRGERATAPDASEPSGGTQSVYRNEVFPAFGLRWDSAISTLFQLQASTARMF